MKLRLNGIWSDVFISLYAILSLFFRFKMEAEYTVSIANSLVIGLAFILIIWALIKLKFLNPNWFGLFKSKDTAP